jgi:hypothetical protein
MSATIGGLVADTPPTLPLWVQWVGAVAAVVAASGVVAVFWTSLSGRFRPWKVRYVDTTLNANTVGQRSITVATGTQYVFIRAKVLSPHGVEFEEFTIVPVSNAWIVPKTTRVWPRQWVRHKRPDAALIQITEVDDEKQRRHINTVGRWHEIDHFPSEDGAGLIARCKPPYFRAKGDVWYLRVAIRSADDWTGHLRIRMASGGGSRLYGYLALKIRKPTSTQAS